jgi:hypothetical protein
MSRYYGVVSIDEALEALGGALAGAGVALWQAPESSAGLDELEAELAPMRLPDEVREFWRRVDVQTLRAEPYPRFSTPEFALVSWRMARDEFAGAEPLALVQVGYESHECMSAELDVDGIEGGVLFQWCVSDVGGFARRFNSMADWVNHVAGLIGDGSYVRIENGQGHCLLVPPPEDIRTELAERTGPPTHPRYGDTLNVSDDILDWPEHWQRVNGLRADNLELRGATHNVSDVLDSPPAQELRATIAAYVVDLAGGGAGGIRVRVDDATGTMDVACPPDTTLLGPVLHGWYEFDIVVAPGARQRPSDPAVATAGVTDPVEQVTAALMARYGGPAAATAEAIRRMSAPHDSTG